jgi:hypothetical protein
MNSHGHVLCDADPTRLQAHLGHCADARGRLHRLRGVMAAMDAQLQPRFVCTLAVLALLLVGLALLWRATAA